MLSNIIILLLKSPSHLLSPIPQTHPTTLFDFLTISLICALSVYLFYFHSFPVPLILFTLPLSLIEHHHFRLLNIHYQLFLPHVLSQVLGFHLYVCCSILTRFCGSVYLTLFLKRFCGHSCFDLLELPEVSHSG
jgi:hypothetical protein